MTFDVIVGNPPYQENLSRTSDGSIYYKFMDLAYDLCGKVILITPGRFLFDAGKTPKAWNKKMLSDKHLKVLLYESNSNDVFPEIDLKGGIAVTLRDENYIYGGIGIYSRYKELNTILQKVRKKADFLPLSEIIILQNKFDLVSLYLDYPNYEKIIGSSGREKRLTTSIFTQLSIFKDTVKSDRDIEILGLINNMRNYKFIDEKYIEAHKNVDCFKVVLPKSNGTGKLGEVLSTPIVRRPKTGFTQSFISIGKFSEAKEANACLKYIKTKFVRTMLGVLKATQDNNKAVWRFVPSQDFSSNSDLDWNKSIDEIDQQLYKKYKLTKKEIDFIEKMIKPMK